MRFQHVPHRHRSAEIDSLPVCCLLPLSMSHSRTNERRRLSIVYPLSSAAPRTFCLWSANERRPFHREMASYAVAVGLQLRLADAFVLMLDRAPVLHSIAFQ